MYSLIEAEYKRSLAQTAVEKLVRDAKTRSEVAPGVGSETQVRTKPRVNRCGLCEPLLNRSLID